MRHIIKTQVIFYDFAQGGIMKYLIIGSGGREHTLAWRLLHDSSASEVFAAPGNGGFEKAYRTGIGMHDYKEIVSFCIKNKIDVVIVGPEAPLVDGIVDVLQENKIPVFGPTRQGAMLEGSKLFAKNIMEKNNVPTGRHNDFNDKNKILEYIESVTQFPIVIKLDGLAAGKGVGIPENKEEALAFVEKNVIDGATVFIEEFFDGEEASVIGIADGDDIVTFVSAQDHKRIFENDKGPNTGGMGAYGPAPIMTEERLQEVHDRVLMPTIRGMKQEGAPFKGILYAGLIMVNNEMKVLEFNTRFGDPEAQVILPLLEGKLGDVIESSLNGTIKNTQLTFKDQHAITVVMASGGYPGAYEKGKLITGLDAVSNDIIVFHAGTKEEDGKYYTNGGRVLNVTALGNTLQEARDKVYSEIDKISFEGAYYRKDIAHRAL